MRVPAKKLRGTEAAEIAEAALVMPVVFIFLLGIIWFGRAFNIYSTITQAAQQGVIVAARSGCATCGTSFPGDVPVANAVISVMQASSLDPSQIPPGTGTLSLGCTSSSNIQICRQVVLNSSPGNSAPQPCTPGTAQVCGTTVSFQYPFQFYLPFTSLNLSKVILSAQAESRMEN
ncbi:MAG: TadE/TadG family type IV pilus assembly protein [Terriglobales bacterium]